MPPKLKRRTPYGAHHGPKSPRYKPKKVRIAKQTTTIVFQRSNDSTPKTAGRPIPIRRQNTPIPQLAKQGVDNLSFSIESLDNKAKLTTKGEPKHNGIFTISDTVIEGTAESEKASIPGSTEEGADNLAFSSDSLSSEDDHQSESYSSGTEDNSPDTSSGEASGSNSSDSKENSPGLCSVKENSHGLCSVKTELLDACSVKEKSPDPCSVLEGEETLAYNRDSAKSRESIVADSKDAEGGTAPPKEIHTISGAAPRDTIADACVGSPPEETDKLDVEALIVKAEDAADAGEDNLAIEMTNLDV